MASMNEEQENAQMQERNSTNQDYLASLKTELEQIDPSVTSNALRLLNDEIKRIEQGGNKKITPLVEAHHARPQGVAVKVKIPVAQFPKFNFVGKLLGPKGMSLKRLQEETGTKMSILGRGSMRDKAKEEELKKEGGKYAHLNEDLHLLIEVYSEIADSYGRLSHALSEVRKFLTPEYNDEIAQEQMQQMMYMNGDKPAGRGRGRGRGGALLGGGPPAGARGGPRGGPRGGRGAPRGAAARGRAPPAPVSKPEPAYEEYSQAYEEYPEPYSRDYESSYSTSGGDTQYFDYGHGSSAASYSDSYGEGSGWGAQSAQPMKAPSTRGARGQYRSHPYSAPARGGY